MTNSSLTKISMLQVQFPKSTQACQIIGYFMTVSFSDIHKMDEWETLIESDIKTLKLEDSDLSDDEEDESDSDEDSEDMDVS